MISEILRHVNAARRAASAASIALTLCGSVPSALAQSAQPARAKPAPKAAVASEADPGNTPAYRSLVEQALNEFKLENWPEARILFRRAHELNPNARTLRGIGVVSYEMRDYVPARVALTAALADTRQPLTAAQRKECEELLARTETFVAAYDLKLSPANLDLTVDGAPPVYDEAGRLLLGFGEHTLKGSAEGFESGSVTIAVQGGEKAAAELTLRPPAAEQPVAATLPVTPESSPRAQTAPLAPVSLEREGGLRYTWVALGASAVLGGGAVGAWFVGERKFDQLKERCQRAASEGSGCAPGSVDTSSVKRMERLTNGLMGASAASLVVAAILLPIEWPRERRSIALDLSPRNVGVRGSF